MNRPTGFGSVGSSVERSGISLMVENQARRLAIGSSANAGNAIPNRSASRTHSCTSCSSESDGDTFSPPCSPRPERPNRSRRPFAFLRERSVAGFSRFYRRSEATPTTGNAFAQPSSLGRGAAHNRRENRRRASTGFLAGPPGFPHPLHASAIRLAEQTRFGLGRNQATRDGDMILPCGLFQEEIIDLMYRDLNPEDFEMLSKLDERLPKRNTAHSKIIDVLPRVVAEEPGVSECRVCLAEVAPTTLLAQLPCQHAFHPECISKWLTQCKNTCPLCSKPIEAARDGLPSRKGHIPSTTPGREECAPRQLEPRSLPMAIHREVRSLHL